MLLSDLTLSQLSELASILTQIEVAGDLLNARGLDPRFDLTPGRPATISLNFVMTVGADLPEDGETVAESIARIDENGHETDRALHRTMQRVSQIEVALATGPQLVMPEGAAPRTVYLSKGPLTADAIQQARTRTTPSTEAAPVTAGEAALPEPVPAPVESPPADAHAGGQPQSEIFPVPSSAEAMPEPIPPAASVPQTAPVADAGAAEAGDGGQALTAAPVADPIAMPAPSAAGKPAPWTVEEETRLIELVCVGVQRLGLSRAAAIRSAAYELGRPEEGTKFRCNHNVKDRLRLALQAHTVGEAQPSPAVQSADPLQAHLAQIAGMWGWSFDDDCLLMADIIAGVHIEVITADLDRDVADCKRRFDALTGLTKTYGKQASSMTRRFKREDVLAALRGLTKAA
jgi:hypothetical protein